MATTPHDDAEPIKQTAASRSAAINALVMQSINRLCKWRSVFTGWQLGTRPATDPEAQAVSEGVDARLILRAEVQALTLLLIRKNKFTQEEFALETANAANNLCLQLEQKFPGFKATDTGMDIDVKIAAITTKGWKP